MVELHELYIIKGLLTVVRKRYSVQKLSYLFSYILRTQNVIVLKMNKRKTGLGMLLLLMTVVSSVLPVFACSYGLTPGYWKNIRKHEWPAGYDDDDLFGDYFADDMDGATLMDALKFHGGPGIEGAKRILARAAVACLLSQATFDPSEVNWVIHDTNWWLLNGDRA